MWTEGWHGEKTLIEVTAAVVSFSVLFLNIHISISIFPICKNVYSIAESVYLYYILFLYWCFLLLRYPLFCFNTANFPAVGLWLLPWGSSCLICMCCDCAIFKVLKKDSRHVWTLIWPCSDPCGYIFKSSRYAQSTRTSMWTMLLQLLLPVCAFLSKASISQTILLVLGCIRVVITVAYTLASSLVAYVTFTTAVSVSVFTGKQDGERKEIIRYSKQRFGPHSHMHIAGLCCCRRWVRHASSFPWWPREPLVCVNPLQPSPHWLPSRPRCCLYRQELLNTIASLPLAQWRI